jgi:signal transduction histidine kinase
VFSLGAYLAFAVLFYSPITPRSFFSNGNNLAALWTLPIAAFSVIGALIALRKPDNPIGWLCLAGGVIGGLSSLASEVGSLLDSAHVGAGAWILLLSAPTGLVALSFGGLILVVLLLFPDGHLPSPGWRWVVGVLALASVTGLVLNLVDPTPGNLGESSRDVSALAIRGSAPLISTLGWLTSVALLFFGAAAVVSVFLRLRGADADRRHQIKWVAYAGLLPVIVIFGLTVIPLPADTPQVINLMVAALTALAILSVPIAIGIAVLKYRLYDIDVIINRTLVYGALAAFITAVYVGIAVGIGTLVGSGGQPNLWLSIVATIIVAVGFQPLRERLQRIANRLVYGTRATPYEVLSKFSEHVAETYAADEVLPRMAQVLQEATGAESATVWLRANGELLPATTYPETLVTQGALPMGNGTLPGMPGTTRAVGVRHQDELLGALSVSKRRGEGLTPIEEKLVDDLAHQAGLVLKNVGLRADLQARLEELHSSRQRLVQAQDEERRRLERNLHDGAQQYLVAIKVKLGLVQTLLTSAPAQARATIAQLKGDADEALETLRDLARGIYPPLLADKGLVMALESQARKATVAVTVEAEGVGRYAQDIEATVYFCVLEALQNVQKYARATHAIVRVRATAGGLGFEVSDDGAGFDTTTPHGGTGLTNMSDRMDALGGSVEVKSRPGRGTSVRGELPIPAAAGIAS